MGRTLSAEGQKGPDDGENNGGQQVGNLDFFTPHQIEAHAKDEDVAGEGQVGQGLRSHDGFNKGGQQGDGALKNGHGNGGKNASLAEGGGHDHDDDQVKYGLGGQSGVVAQGAILNGAHHSHGSNAYGEGSGDKAAHKAGVAFTAGFALKPLAKLFKAALQIEKFAKERAQREADDHHHSAARFQTQSGDFVHLRKTTGDTDEEHADSVGTHEGILKALGEAFAEEQAAQAAGEDAGHVDKSTESDHARGSSLVVDERPSNLAALSRQTFRYTVSEMAPLLQRPSMKSRKVKGCVLNEAQISQP